MLKIKEIFKYYILHLIIFQFCHCIHNNDMKYALRGDLKLRFRYLHQSKELT